MLHQIRLISSCGGLLAVVIALAVIVFGTDRLSEEVSERLSIPSEYAAALVSGSLVFAFAAPVAALVAQWQENRRLALRFGHFARHDSSTGLLNREGFTDALDALVCGDFLHRNGIGVVHVEMIGIQLVNDAYGHEAGDAVLQTVARDLAGVAGPGALLGRLAGAEFVVAFPIEKRHSKGYAQRHAHETGERLLAAIARPRVIDAHEFELSANMGVCAGPEGGETAAALLKNTHLALTAAKGAGPGAIRFFDRALETLVGERRAIERRVREAVATRSFELHFQPLYSNRERKLVGYEALLRLPSGGEGFISPAVFVPIAEELGLISKIGDWVIRSACAFAAEWPGDYSVAVNLSPAQFRDGSVSRVVREALAETGLAPRRLELEITEGLLMNDTQAVLNELNMLKELGVSIVMDDFGTGYSSLSYLWKFPFDKIKIDRSFMRGLDEKDSLVGDILLAIVSLSRSLHLRVTAEGVETQAQSEFLRELACDEVQGFLLGRPMPMTDVAASFQREEISRADRERHALGGMAH